MQTVLELKNIRRHFAGQAAVDDISLKIERGEILGIIGRSGAGKSTLIRCINGLERVDEGKILFEDKIINQQGQLSQQQERHKTHHWRDVQRKIGMVFQHFNLLSSRRILENVALPLKIEHIPKPQRRIRALEMLELVGLADRANDYPAQLSGGQKQRVGIARALAANPSLLLCDEATSALDPETTASILELLERINQQMHLTIMLVTHEMDVIRKLAKRVIVLDSGRVVEEATVRDIILAPQSNVAKSLLASSIPQLPAHIATNIQPHPPVVGRFEVVVKLRLFGEVASHPFLHDLNRRTGLIGRLVQGGIEHVQGEAIGHFFIHIGIEEMSELGALEKWLESFTSEVLGFVSI